MRPDSTSVCSLLLRVGFIVHALSVPAYAATLNVPTGFASIQSAIDAAGPGDEIVVAPGVYAEQINFLGKNITVRSSGGPAVTTITGGGTAGPIVSLVSGEPSSSRLQGFTITGGFVQDADGAGVRLIGASTAIQDCIIDSNQTFGQCGGCQARGGGMSISGGSPTLSGVTFTNNRAFPAAISGIPKGGGLWVGNAATVTITGGSFINNATLNRDGGGMFIEGQAEVFVNGTTFDSNFTESGSGGAVYVLASTFRSQNATYRRNYSRFGGGGGITALGESSVEVTGCQFIENNWPASDSELGAFGGIEMNDGTLTATNATFTGNVAQGGTGGGINLEFATAFVNNCTFTENVSPGGAGPGIAAKGGSLQVTGGTFSNNSGNGAGIWGTDGVVIQVTGATFTNNLANGGAGGGIGLRASTFTLSQLTFTGNRAPGGSGGGVSIDGLASGTLQNSTFTNHDAPGGSGAAINVRGGASVTLAGLTINGATNARAVALANCTAQFSDSTISNAEWGGVSVGAGANATLERLTLLNNGVSGGGAGGINATGGVFTARDCLIKGESATGGSGGAVWLSGASVGTLERCTIIGNGQPDASGSIVRTSNTSSLTLINCLAHSNEGSTSGAVVINANSIVTLINSTFAGNNPGAGEAMILVSSSSAGQPARLVAYNSILRGLAGGGSFVIRRAGTNTALTVNTCNVEGGLTDGVNITSADPLFINASGGDYRLGTGSPGLNAGDPAFIPVGVTTDLESGPRVVGPGPDLGAYERDSVACNLADVTDIGDSGAGPDGQLTVDDIIAFVNTFGEAGGCPGAAPCNRSDVTDIGNTGAGPDGELTVDDIIAFVNAFGEGC